MILDVWSRNFEEKKPSLSLEKNLTKIAHIFKILVLPGGSKSRTKRDPLTVYRFRIVDSLLHSLNRCLLSEVQFLSTVGLLQLRCLPPHKIPPKEGSL